MRSRAAFRHLMLASTALMPLGIVVAVANPLAPNVAGGGATVTGVGTSSVTVNQSTPRAIINWNTFNIGAGETTRFVQPDTSAIALNRVTGSLGPSTINGMLTANGRVFLVNPDGVMISRSGTVNTAGFLATTNDISNANFMAGKYHFSIPGRPDASIVNEGRINAHSQGFAALVAPGVRNSGTITARYGKIGLAAGNDFSLDFYGDQLITLAVGDSIKATVRDVATGQPLGALVKNDGKLKATGGRVELTAAQARTVVDSVINNSGVIEARSVGTRQGKIVLGASTTKVAGLPPQTVKVSGKLDVSNTSGKGGTIQVTGEKIVIKAASFDASGATGGGTVLIGGDTGGGHGHWAVASIPQAALEAKAIPNTATVEIDAATVINASATSVGNGGKVIVWADGGTIFEGTILGRGGEQGGNGGFAEVSGKQVLAYNGTTDTRAPYGSFGTLLLDPGDMTIQNDGDTSFTGSNTENTTLNVAVLNSALASNNVIVQTGTAPTGPGSGDIIVNAEILWSAGTTLTLSAFRDIRLPELARQTSTPNIRNTGAGHLVLRADSTGTGTGTIVMPPQTNPAPPVRVDWSGSTGTVKAYYNPGSYSTPTNFTVGNGIFDLASTSQLTSYMLVNSVTNLQALQANATTLGGIYALGRDFSAAGFVPAGPGTTLTGLLDGNGGLGINHTISNLSIAAGSPGPIGLFGFIDTGATVRNLNLANVNFTATGNTVFIAPLAGENRGTIQNVHVQSGSVGVSSQSLFGIIAGGLVGQNRGTISNSSSAANVTVGNATSLFGINIAGGLVGSNLGTITLSSASGNVSGGNNSSLGGLAGQNGLFGMGGGTGTITSSSASGNVSSAGVNVSLGGLVGFNTSSGEVSQVSASGNVTSTGQAVNGGPNCSMNNSCQNITVGGLIGQNSGLVSLASASGAVHAGSGGTGGGLIGRNDGIVDTTYHEIGAVTGAAGIPGASENFDNDTTLGGLIGSNQGLLTNSYATGNVGSPGVNWLTAGGLVGDNSGLIALTYATGNVRAGNFSMAGGLVGSGDSGCMGCSMGVGAIYSNLNHISSSTASGAVSVGSSSIAGGFAGGGSFIYDSQSSGNVTGGSNSLLGGFVGVHSIDGLIFQSTASGPVTATGPSTWAGGFVGYNGGVIFDSTTASTSTVTGTSSSILGGFAAVNIGWIDPSAANGAVTATGANNILGGFAGLNLGTIDNSTSTGAVTGGVNSIVGGFVGANAAFANFSPGLIPISSFPAGTVNNSTASGIATGGAGSTVGAQIATTSPGTLPIPGLVQNCTDTMCEIFRTGVLAGLPIQPDPVIPDQVLAPPSEPIIPNEVQAPPTTQLLQFRTEPQPPNDALIKLTSLVQTVQQQTNANQQTNADRQTGPSQTPGTPPASSAPRRPLRAVPGPDGEIRSNVPPLNETRFLANEIVLHMLANTSPASVQQIAQQLGLTLIAQQNLSSLGRTAFRLQIGGGRSVRDIIRALEANSIVAMAVPNYTYTLVQQVPAAIAPFTASRGDPAQYTMGKLNLNEAHRVASGNNIIVAVIDSEVDRDHAELAGTISQRFDATDSESKAHSHGTAMAGAIVSRERLLGIAPGAKILAVRAFSETSGSAESTSFNILKGMEWAISQGARVINMSFAGPYDPALERALKDAAAKGVVLIGASGNAGPKSPPLWPGADPNVIAVTATDSGDKLFRQANRGPYVSVASPGVEILAPAPQAGYQLSTGTSIATAHISGVVALMLERDPSLTPRDVRLILESTAADLGPKGRDTQFGWGLVNPAKALAMVDERKRQKGTTSAPTPATTPVQR